MKELMNTFVGFLILAFVIGDEAVAAAPAEKDPALLRVYEVNKRVSDFPEKEDFSSPEAAYAVINRVVASGWAGGPVWQRISVERLSKPLAKGKKVEMDFFMQKAIMQPLLFIIN